MISTPLAVLWLDSSNVSDTSLDQLAQMKQLTKLHLRKTRITKEGYEKLRMSLPDTLIYYTPRDD